MRRFFSISLLLLFFCQLSVVAQSVDTTLNEVIIKAFSNGRNRKETPAAVNLISKKDLDAGSQINVLEAVNNTPGVRMEERSPGSYRLNIRGSSLRAPFGVKNVKIYYNSIPVSDPGGFCYFNQFGVSNINDLQILKGPSSSLYGAGNGGVLLLNSMPDKLINGVTVGSIFGAYGMNRTYAEIRNGDSMVQNILKYEHVQSQGYRQQSAMNKNMISYDASIKQGTKSVIGIHLLYNNLEYQTPGAVTRKEYDLNAQIARPDAGKIPGAIKQDAHIVQDNLLLGISFKRFISKNWQNATTIYGLYSKFDNPSIRNYSKTIDPHFGGRSSFDFQKEFGESKLNLTIGVEAQKSFALVSTYANKLGVLDTLQSSDEILSSNVLGFAQGSWKFRKLVIEAGLGISNYAVGIQRLSIPGMKTISLKNEQLSPRIALLYAPNNKASLYATIARGYSSPTTAEFAPSGSAINSVLKAEYGWNYELGARGALLNGKLSYDFSLFYYTLTHSIVLRKDSLGGDNYINAGSTNQQGFEAKIDYLPISNKERVLSLLKCWASYTGYHFRYQNFVQGGTDFSGKKLPGNSPHTLAMGMDASFKFGFSLYATYFFSDKVALNDGNTAFADPYHLLGLKIAYNFSYRKLKPELFIGANNLLNQKYSLGNDINAAGGRYYNAAMPLNIYAGLVISLNR